MTRLLHQLLGRLPIGWLQLTHNRTRLVAALAGVAFANILVFVQLGMLGTLQGTVGATYSLVQADILISSSDANTLTDGSPLTRRVMFQALAEPGVAAAAPLYLGQTDWTRPDGSTATLTVYGLPPEAESFAGPALGSGFRQLAVADRVLLDLRTRGVDPESLADVSPHQPLRFEANGVALTAVDTFELGGGFSADGAMVASDQTFLRLFGQRLAGTPTHILVRVAERQDPTLVAAGLREALGDAPERRKFEPSFRHFGIVGTGNPGQRPTRGGHGDFATFALGRQQGPQCRVAQLSTYTFLLTGCSEKFLLEVEATSLADLAQELSCKRFIVGRIKAVDGEATSQGVLLPVPRIALVVEPE